MRRSEDFARAIKKGVRVGNCRLVIHYAAGEAGAINPALVGVVVPKKQVARATHRNRIKRRIRALIRLNYLENLEPGARIVIRALAAADGAASAVLAHDLDRMFLRIKQRQGH